MEDNTQNNLNLSEGTTTPKEVIFLNEGVKKGVYSPIRIRFDTALKSKGLQWFEVYHKVGISKHYASQIRNGHFNPPLAMKIRIAEAIGVDTRVLWEENNE